MAELPGLGDHCSLKFCQTLDFLPIKCDLCSLKFCKEHFSYDSHFCVKYKELNQINSSSSSNSVAPIISRYTCSLDGCKTKELVAIVCDKCKLNFCVQHRLQIDHECKFDSALSANQAKTGQRSNEFKFELKTNVSEKNTNLAAKLVLMKLKQTADGPPGLPEEAKFYCFIEYQNIKKPFFLSNKWPIGRCEEFLCQKLNIKQKNDLSLRLENNDFINKSSIVQELLDKQILKQAFVLRLN